MILPSVSTVQQESTFAYFYANNRTPFSMSISKYTLPADLKRQIQQQWRTNTSRYRLFNFKGIELNFQDILFQKNGVIKVYITFQGREIDSKFIYYEYDVISILGSGNTILARHKDTLQQIVIKRIKAKIGNADEVDSFFKNCGLLKCIDHPNLIQIQNILILTNMDIMIFKQYIQGLTLYELFNKQKNGIDEYQIRNYVLQIVQCLDYCQTTGIQFQDLNLNDIILDGQQQIKILNFGHSALQIKQIAQNYMAPEQFYPHNEQDLNSIGIWAVGIIAFALVYGRFPFDIKNDSDQSYGIETLIQQYQFQFAGKEVSVEFRDFILRIFQLDPNQRIQMHHLFKLPIESTTPKNIKPYLKLVLIILIHPWLLQKQLTSFSVEEPKFKIQLQMRKIYNQQKKTEIPKRFRSHTPQNSMRNKLKLYAYGREFRIRSMQQQ